MGAEDGLDATRRRAAAGLEEKRAIFVRGRRQELKEERCPTTLSAAGRRNAESGSRQGTTFASAILFVGAPQRKGLTIPQATAGTVEVNHLEERLVSFIRKIAAGKWGAMCTGPGAWTGLDASCTTRDR